MPPLHVAMVVARFPPYMGGCELQAFHLGKELSKRDIRVSILTQHFSRETPAFESRDGMEIHRLAAGATGTRWESPAFIVAAVRQLKALKPDVSHAHMLSSPAVAAAAARKFLGIPAIALGTGVGPIGEVGMARNSFFRQAKFRYLKAHLNAAVCTLSLMKDEFRQIGFSDSQIRLIPNGVDNERFKPGDPFAKEKLKQTLDLPADSFVAVYTGRLSSEKGVDVLLEAWARWNPEEKSILIIIGDGPDRKRLETLNVPRIQWAGKVENVPDYLQAADVLVLPSRGEALSNSLLEAMASGVASIGTQVGGTPEILDEGRRGLLVPPEDPAALANALDILFRNANMRQRLGQAGKAAVEARYSLKTVARSYIQLYEEILSLRPR